MSNTTTIKKSTWSPDDPIVQSYLKDLRTRWKVNLFFLSKLPSMWFWGARVKYVDHKRCEVHLPLRWSSKNPFQSIYFAAQAGAAEFTSGAIAGIAVKGRGPFSMLIKDISIEFTKKAKEASLFVCEEGEKVIAAINKAEETGQAQTVTVTSVGKMKDGTVVSVTKLTWSFLSKS